MAKINVDELSDDDIDKIIAMWRNDPCDPYYKTIVCRNDNCQRYPCRYSHTRIKGTFALRCTNCARDACTADTIVSQTIMRSYSTVSAFVICKSVAEQLMKNRDTKEAVNKKRERTVDSTCCILTTNSNSEDTKPNIIESSSMNPTDMSQRKMLRISDQKPIKLAKTEEVCVYLRADKSNCAEIMDVLSNDKFAGMIKINSMHFYTFARELKPETILKFREEILKIPSGDLIVENAELRVELSRKNA